MCKLMSSAIRRHWTSQQIIRFKKHICMNTPVANVEVHVVLIHEVGDPISTIDITSEASTRPSLCWRMICRHAPRKVEGWSIESLMLKRQFSAESHIVIRVIDIYKKPRQQCPLSICE